MARANLQLELSLIAHGAFLYLRISFNNELILSATQAVGMFCLK